MMDSNKSNIDSARIEFYENIEKLCCSPEVSAKDIVRIICKATEILYNKNGIVLNDNYKSLLDFANSEYECDDEKIKHRFYKETRKVHLSLLKKISSAHPLVEDSSKESQDTSDIQPTASDLEDNLDDSDEDSTLESSSLQSTGDQSTAAESDGKGNASEGSSYSLIDFAKKLGVSIGDDEEPDDKSDSNSDNPEAKKSPRKQPSIIKLERKLTSKTPFIVRNGLVYHYDNEAHYYKLVDQDDVIKLYRSYIDPKLNKSPNLRNYNDLYRCIKTDPWLERDGDLDPETCCPLQNGLYFINKYDGIHQLDHKPIFITFTCLNASYDENAECKTFKKFIDDTTGGRKELKKRLLMALGYLLVNTPRGKFFFLAGFKPNTGKSVLFNFIQRLYPPESVSNLPVGDLGGRFESEALLHSRINISLDLPQEPLNASAVAKLKQITGGDTVEVQRKGKTSKKLDHPVKLVFASNSRLRLKKDDTAFWNRLIYLPFENTVTEEDPDLSEKLWNERDGIVTYLLKYALMLEKLDYKFPHIPEDDTKVSVEKRPTDYLPGFINSCCERGADFFCPTSNMRKAYEDYCYDNFIPACSPTAFNTYMESINIERKKLCYPRPSDKQVRGFKGIRLRQSDDSFDDLV